MELSQGATGSERLNQEEDLESNTTQLTTRSRLLNIIPNCMWLQYFVKRTDLNAPSNINEVELFTLCCASSEMTGVYAQVQGAESLSYPLQGPSVHKHCE